jgi:hypothetical protein
MPNMMIKKRKEKKNKIEEDGGKEAKREGKSVLFFIIH